MALALLQIVARSHLRFAEDVFPALLVLVVVTLVLLAIWWAQQKGQQEMKVERDANERRDRQKAADGSAAWQVQIEGEQAKIRERGLQHYSFVFDLLLGAFFADPAGFMQRMQPDADRHARFGIIDLWSKAAVKSMMAGLNMLDFSERPQHRPVVVAGCPAILFTMPTPQVVPEAYYAVAIAAGDVHGPVYYTLEMAPASSKDAPPQTVLGQVAPPSRMNLGAGPAPQEDLFLAAVEARLKITSGSPKPTPSA